MLIRHTFAALGLAVTTASLFGCASTVHDTTHDIVTKANVATISHDVESDRSLSRKDRDRFFAFIADHETSPDAYDGKHITDIINLQKAHEVARRMQIEAEREDTKHRDMIARLIEAHIARTNEHDRSIDFLLHVKNLARKPIAHLELGLEVHDASGKRIGLAEMRTSAHVGAGTERDISIPMRYVRFGEDAGTMREAAGQAKQYDLLVKEITYTDGSDAGYDD